MEQVSLPMRIALLAVLAFAGLWLVALRPKPGGEPGTPTPSAQQQPVKAATPAKSGKGSEANATATAKTPAGAKSAKAATGTAATKPAAAKAAPDAAAKKADTVPKPVQAVLGDLEDRKVVVLLFSNGELSDDREVARAVRAVDRRGGRVSVRTASIAKLGDYEPITRDVPVVTSPTTLVIDRDRRAKAISGLTVTSEIDQIVGKALAGK